MALSTLLLIPPICLVILESASLAIEGPKIKNSTTSSFLSMSRMKMMKNTQASGNSTILDVVGLLDPMCHFVLFALLLEYEHWNQRLSCRQCCYIVLVVGKVHYS